MEAKRSDEYRNKMRESSVKLWQDDEFKTTVIESNKASHNTAESRERHSSIAKDLWEDKDYAERIKSTWNDDKKNEMSQNKQEFFAHNIEDRFRRFIEQAIMVHGDKYDYSEVNYVNADTKVIIICPKHGEFEQEPGNHLQGQGCKLCGIEKSQHAHRLSTPDFVDRAISVHGDRYDYENSDYYGTKTKVKIMCPRHGEFEQIPNCHLSGNGCPKCAGTHLQNNINTFVQSLGFETQFNDRTAIYPYELDIYVPQKKFGIEVHGIFWHSYDHIETKEEKECHSFKADLCSDRNIRSVQIFEHEWIEKQDVVKSIIRAKLGKSDRIYARKCDIVNIDSSRYREFVGGNHLQGSRPASVRLGLEYDGELVSMLSISKHDKYQWEIMRFANKLGLSVLGGASKLFKHFVNNWNPTNVLTYADRRYSDGDLYKKLGFRLDSITNPNYYYVMRNVVYSRQQFQKHKLKDKLKIFDPDKSEAENMFNNGYRRLWDAGHYKFIWSK
ncbi:MAG: hypothetical protein GF411_02780 [Candidatus Lokiarchaeota archaeon]|nr:hypothetical protein [Candidatus Lokiarchaeota archaeon]